MIQPLSAEAFALASNVLHMANLHCSPQLVQLTQPQHLLGRQAVIGALHLHQLQGKGGWLEVCLEEVKDHQLPHKKYFFMAVICNKNNRDFSTMEGPVGAEL